MIKCCDSDNHSCFDLRSELLFLSVDLLVLFLWMSGISTSIIQRQLNASQSPIQTNFNQRPTAIIAIIII